MATTSLDKCVIYRRFDDTGLLQLASPTTQLGAGSSAGVTGIAIGFSFVFDGVTYTTVDLAARGFARLAGTVTTASNAALFAAGTSDVCLAPWWDDLKTADSIGYIKTELQGTAPFRRFVVEWRVYAVSTQTSSDSDSLRFQLVLHETTNRAAFRYGVRVRTGSPAGTPSASIGVRGSTVSVSDNVRDFTVDDLELGGSKTAATTSLGMSSYDRLPTFWIEPAWPMSGRYFPITIAELSGLQDPYSEPIWKIANNVHYHYANFAPAVVSYAPFQQVGQTAIEFVVPCEASPDVGLTYRMTAIVFASSAATCSVGVDKPAAADPQPGVSGDWTQIGSGSQAVGSGWTQLTAIALPALVTAGVPEPCLRFRFSVSAGLVNVGHVIVTQVPLTEIDPSAVYASDFVPMGIGQLRQQGAPVHPEWYNRAFANIGRILRRPQMAWSSVWPELSLVSIASATGRTSRQIAVSRAVLKGWRGQEVSVRVYARDTSGGTPLTVAERGGTSVTFTVASSGGEYRLQELPLELVSEEPEISVSAEPVGTLSPMAVVVLWAPSLPTEDILVGVTPAPRLEALARIVSRLDRALRAYAIPGNATLLARGKTTANKWALQVQIPPAVYALQPKVTRVAADLGHQAKDTRIQATTSGSGAADEIWIPSPLSEGIDDYPPEGALAVAAGALVDEPAPGAAMDRLLESPTATSLGAAVLERVDVCRGVGWTAVPIFRAPSAI